MAYLKAHYHIDEVVEILQEHDYSVSRESILDLGARGFLKIGLLSLPVTEFGYKDLWSQKLAAEQGYEIHDFSSFGNSYKKLARLLFDGHKQFIKLAKTNHHDKPHYLEVAIDSANHFLRSYKYSRKLRAQFKNMGRNTDPVLFFKLEQQIYEDTSYDPLIDDIGIRNKPEILIFPLFNFSNNWLHKVINGNTSYLTCYAFITAEEDILIPVEPVESLIEAQEIPESYQDWVCEDEDKDDLYHFELIYQHQINNQYLKQLIENDRFFITRRELMRFEQQNLGIDHGLDLTKHTESKPEQNITPKNEAPSKTALKVIGLLMLHLNKGKYTNNGSPNKSRIKELLLELAKENKIDDYGLSKVDERLLTDALTYLEEQKKD